jgi:tetratricopeptide (TPR) repeat protein
MPALRLCQVLAAKAELDQAIITGEQAIKDNPRYPELYIQMGNLYESKSDWNRAESAFQNALAINSQDPVACNELARAMLHAGGDSDVALSLAQAALRGLPNSPAVADTLGWIYYQKGALALAINYLEEALRLEEQNHLQDNPDVRYHLGMAYVKTRQLALAREQFERVLKTSPDFQDAAEIKKQLIGLKS